MAGPAEPRTPSRGPRLRRRSVDILLLEEGDILSMATAMQNSRVRGVVLATGMTKDQAAELRARISRPISARRPLHPLLGQDAGMRSLMVGDYRSKDMAVQTISSWAALRGLNSRTLAALEQAVDELLLNALFDAPQDGNGRPRYIGLLPRQRLECKALPGEHAEVRYASDAQRVVVAVRDRFGALRRGTIIDYLVRCASAQSIRRSPLEDKVGGAGVGLYLSAGAASELLFRLRRDRLTEVVYVVYRERARPLRILLIDDDDGMSWGRGSRRRL